MSKMKRICKLALCTAMAALVSVGAFAQPNAEKGKKDKGEWKEKVQAEKVAFLTTSLDLSVEESQAFWPVYNAVQKEKGDAFKDVVAATDALKDALKEGKTGKEIEVLLQSYLAAKEDCDAIDKAAIEKYKKVLPIEKVAKIFIAEEQFRHQQIKRLNKDHKPGEGPRPDGQRGDRQFDGQRGNRQGGGFRGGWGRNDGFEE